MKWLTPLLPYLAVFLGIYWFRNAWAALLGFHATIVLSILLARSPIPISRLFESRHIFPVLLSILVSGASGICLYYLWPFLGITVDLPAHLESLGLRRSIWPLFIAYFALVNPLVEEYFWRGFLGSPTRSLYISDFLYSGFHGFILLGNVGVGTMLCGLAVLILAGWFWRQLARKDHGLLAPVLGHVAADLTILLTVYRLSL